MTDVLVLGAGMVGVSTALALQSLGAKVVLADRNAPGSATSHGNAGVIQAEAVEPYALPLNLRALWNIASGRSADVHWDFPGLLANARPLWSYLRHSTAARYRRICTTYSRLIDQATRDHGILIEAAHAQALISQCGLYSALRDAQRLEQQIILANRLKDQYGVPYRLLNGDALHSLEPGVRIRFAGAIHWTGSWHCADPGALVKAYARRFESQGGHFVHADAFALARQRSGWQLQTELGTLHAERVVLALGPWTPVLARRFGMSFPMLGKRGYHLHLIGGATLQAPLVDVERSAVYSPMNCGMRLLTGADIAKNPHPGLAPQMQRALAARTEVLGPAHPVEQKPWCGVRPCMPDMLPVVGAHPLDNALWFNFGHGHQGFTLGPTTGRLLAEQMLEKTSPIDALQPSRFL